MKVEIKGFIVAQQYPWEDKPVFTYTGYDPENVGSSLVKVMEHSFEIDIPDNFDVRPGLVASLNKKKEEINLEFAKRVREIDDQINSLLAIENNA